MTRNARKEQTPTVRSRRLAARLRELRDASGLSATVAGEKAYLSYNWVYRAEKPNCRPEPNNVAAILKVYGVTDEAEVRQLVELAKEASRPGWWDRYRLSADHATLVAFEAEAAAKKVWTPSLIPGLLQTPDYARAVIAAGPDDLKPRRITELVTMRGKRQAALRRDGPLQLAVIVDEAVLRRIVGGRDVMRAQLGHLFEMAHLPNVTVRVLPDGSGEHPGMAGPFTILRFPDPSDADVLFVESLAGNVYAEKAEDVERAHRVFARLETLSLDPGGSMDLVARFAADLHS